MKEETRNEKETITQEMFTTPRTINGKRQRERESLKNVQESKETDTKVILSLINIVLVMGICLTFRLPLFLQYCDLLSVYLRFLCYFVIQTFNTKNGYNIIRFSPPSNISFYVHLRCQIHFYKSIIVIASISLAKYSILISHYFQVVSYNVTILIASILPHKRSILVCLLSESAKV